MEIVIALLILIGALAVGSNSSTSEEASQGKTSFLRTTRYRKSCTRTVQALKRPVGAARSHCEALAIHSVFE